MRDRILSNLSRHRWSLLALLLVILTGIGIRAWLFVDLPDVNDLSAGLHRPSIRITDRNDRLLYEIIGEEEGRHNPVTIEQVPDACINATIATEDAAFYTHPGVDWRGILRALWINVRGGEVIAGGSTITQQVARNILLSPDEAAERTLTRKLRESILAFRLTNRYDKDHILMLYLNQTNYGNLSYGIDAASRSYFGKPTSDLSLAECALLAGLPQAPGAYDPLTNPDAAIRRQSVVLGLMVNQGMITQDEADIASRETLAFASERYSIEAPHFVMAVFNELESTLPPDVLYSGGLTVRTTLDLDWQQTAERIAQRHLRLLNTPQPGDPPHNAHNAALIAMDPYTGEILTMLGSPDYNDLAANGAVNMALAPRQPGSTLKPFTYGLGFDPTHPNPMTAATMLLDVRTSFITKEGYAYVPVNYDRQEHGPVLVREALASSYNIPAVLTLEQVGVENLMRYLGEIGITTLDDPNRYDLSITLGGGETRLTELTAAYAALANGGTVVRPLMILDVIDASGDVVLTNQPRVGRHVMDERVAWLITDILSDNFARSPAFTTHSVLQIGRPAAAKTGTTTDFRDNWTMGYTPNLVVGVWVGNADNSPMLDISGVSGAGPIWHQFMRTVLRGQPELDFERPDGLVQVEVCSLSGLLLSDCPYTRREWFIEGTQPTQPDTFYIRLAIDSATGLPASDGTPSERVAEQVFLDLPSQAHDWARAEGLPLLPSDWGGTSGTVVDDALHILSPDQGTVYRIDPALPRESQRIRFVIAGPADVQSVTLILNGDTWARLDTEPYTIYWELLEGRHSLYAVARLTDGSTLTSEIVRFQVNPPLTTSDN